MKWRSLCLLESNDYRNFVNDGLISWSSLNANFILRCKRPRNKQKASNPLWYLRSDPWYRLCNLPHGLVCSGPCCRYSWLPRSTSGIFIKCNDNPAGFPSKRKNATYYYSPTRTMRYRDVFIRQDELYFRIVMPSHLHRTARDSAITLSRPYFRIKDVVFLTKLNGKDSV